MLHRPAEIHAFQETEKQRRIAQRGEATADVRHQKDKKHNHVNIVLAVIIGFQNRANHQHRRTRRTHHRSQKRADSKQRSVKFGRAV